ncbi:MAG: cytidylate kinase-like family protein [Proteobacteria bacterium]|nr:cytidylate kinase-like family protein [Pseudomonadota bacterium]
MAVVSITRQYGAGAHGIGKMVADRLGFQLIDREILDLVAKQAGVNVSKIKELEHQAGDRLAAFISEMISSASMLRYPAGLAGDLDEQEYRLVLKRVILGLAARGRAVIIGRGAHLILKDHPGAICIYLVAEEKDRVANLMSRQNLDRGKAEKVALREEKKRLVFLDGFGIHDPTDPLIYHAIINTSLVDWEAAADLICRLVEADTREGG